MWKRELLKNKIYSLMLIGLGALSILIEYDATFFVFVSTLGVPLFFAKENWILEIDQRAVIETDSSAASLVTRNDGYTADTKCMCKEFLEQETADISQCGRFEEVGYICE